MSRTMKVALYGLLYMTMAVSGCGKKDRDYVEFKESEVRETPGEEKLSPEEEEFSGEEAAESRKIYVHVCGCVNVPGVYEMAKEARVYEAVEAAGGVTGDAAENEINLADPLSDGDRVYIPSREEITNGMAGGERSAESVPDDGKISINSASEEELMSLSGIGEGRSRAIVDYREKNGGFSDVAELMNVEGIKEGIYNKVKDDIKL